MSWWDRSTEAAGLPVPELQATVMTVKIGTWGIYLPCFLSKVINGRVFAGEAIGQNRKNPGQRPRSR